MLIIRVIFRLIANHCPLSFLRMFLFRLSGVSIGKDSFVNMSLYAVDEYAKNEIVIGDRVAIAPNVSLISRSSPNKSKLLEYGFSKHGKVTIEDDCWLGSNSVVLPGVTIGKMSIVAAGAVVTKDVEPYSIMVGSPAKRIGDVRKNHKLEN